MFTFDRWNVYLPGGKPFQPATVMRLPEDQQRKFVAELRADLLATKAKAGERSFQTTVKSPLSDKELGFHFNWCSGDSATVIFFRHTDEPQKPQIESFAVLFTRIDRQAEDAFIDKLRGNPVLSMIAPESLDEVKNYDKPIIASFFTNEPASTDSQIVAVTDAIGAIVAMNQRHPDVKAISMKLNGMIFYPGMTGTEQFQELVLPDSDKELLLKQFNDGIKSGDGFIISLGIDGDERELTIRFTPVGTTAAFFMMSFDEDGEPQHIHGLTALLTKLDRGEDQKAIDSVRRFAAIGGIDQNSFGMPLEESEPVAATFFADAGSAHYPPIHAVNKALIVAYFGQFGIG